MPGPIGRRGVLLVAAAATIGADRLTKSLATAMLAGTPGHSWLGGAVQLEYARNPGAFLGLGGSWPGGVRLAVFTTFTVLGLVVIAALARRVGALPARVGLGLIAGGALSNLADRLFSGSVVDFLYLELGPLQTGVFNVADVAIFTGGALVVAFARTARPHPPNAHRCPADRT
jgi:signal peptidase II